MKLNYKARYVIVVTYMALVIVSGIPLRFGTLSNYIPFDRWLTTGLYLMLGYTLILTLKAFGENKWRILPFYVLFIFSGISSIATPFIIDYLAQSTSFGEGINSPIVRYFSNLTMLFYVIQLYVLVNVFMLKNVLIARYFKIYGGLLLLNALLFYTRTLIGIQSNGYYIWSQFFLNVLHAACFTPIVILYRKLFNTLANFKQSDIVVSKREIENVPAGTAGVIIIKHTESGYFEVEFSDAAGNLINVLMVAADDIERAAVPDLKARIETFGS